MNLTGDDAFWEFVYTISPDAQTLPVIREDLLTGEGARLFSHIKACFYKSLSGFGDGNRMGDGLGFFCKAAFDKFKDAFPVCGRVTEGDLICTLRCIDGLYDMTLLDSDPSFFYPAIAMRASGFACISFHAYFMLEMRRRPAFQET